MVVIHRLLDEQCGSLPWKYIVYIKPEMMCEFGYKSLEFQARVRVYL